jgi:hypothetical protein
MESLNKQQLVLLALLVSFVTSIATGIVTVSLMEQAPPEVTQTINRVVEKTIERVVSAPSQPASVITTKETVVVKADDLVIEGIEKNAKHLVRIKERIGEGENKEEAFAGIGLLVSSEGLIVSDFGVAYQKEDEAGNLLPETYVGVFQDGERRALTIVRSDKEAGLIAFRPSAESGAKESEASFSTPTLSETEPKLGQAVIALGGAENNSVSTGIVARLLRGESAPAGGTVARESATGTPEQSATTTPSFAPLVAIKTDIQLSELVRGAVLLNLSGEVIGMSAGGGRENAVFVPVEIIARFISGIGSAEEGKKSGASGLQ